MTWKPPGRDAGLADWLGWIETCHKWEIDLGLDRVREVAHRLGRDRLNFPVVTVAGTNGKGSTVAFIEAIGLAAGLHVGAYTSPHLVRFNERVRIGGRETSDEAISAALARIERARGEIPLTYFEFATLAAVECFVEANVGLAVLEVGMGGRLDAVNAFDADVAVITSIGIDHQQWLGDTREAIAREKAGIFRAGRPAIVSEPDPPPALRRIAEATDAVPLFLGAEFRVEREPQGFRVEVAQGDRHHFWGDESPRRAGRSPTRGSPLWPHPALPGEHQYRNAAAAALAVRALGERISSCWCPESAIDAGIRGAVLAARFQTIPGDVPLILDVAHNPEACATLARQLSDSHPNGAGRTIAVFAMLADKDIAASVAAMAPTIDAWHIAALAGGRAASAGLILQAVQRVAPTVEVASWNSPVEALRGARSTAIRGDRIVVFGSFLLVGDILRELKSELQHQDHSQ